MARLAAVEARLVEVAGSVDQLVEAVAHVQDQQRLQQNTLEQILGCLRNWQSLQFPVAFVPFQVHFDGNGGAGAVGTSVAGSPGGNESEGGTVSEVIYSPAPGVEADEARGDGAAENAEECVSTSDGILSGSHGVCVGREGEDPFDNERDGVKGEGKHSKRNNRSRLKKRRPHCDAKPEHVKEAGAGPIDIGGDGNDPSKRVPVVSFHPLLDDESVLSTGVTGGPANLGSDDGNGLVHSGAACSCNLGEDGNDRDKSVDAGHSTPDHNEAYSNALLHVLEDGVSSDGLFTNLGTDALVHFSRTHRGVLRKVIIYIVNLIGQLPPQLRENSQFRDYAARRRHCAASLEDIIEKRQTK